MTKRDIVERLRAALLPLYQDAADEIERLRAAKTAALKIADERSKENVALRAELESYRTGPPNRNTTIAHTVATTSAT